MYGLLDRDLKYVLGAIGKQSEIEEVVIFGSRAMGNYKKGSDVDLALIGESVDAKTVRKLTDILNEVLPLPYFFDVVSINDISNKELREHIRDAGMTIYKKAGAWATETGEVDQLRNEHPGDRKR